MRGRWAWVPFVAGCVACGSSYPLAGQDMPGSWARPVAPFQIAEDLWYVGTEELASYLFTSPEGHILIDVPLEETVDLLESNIRALGFDPADVRVVITSQAHDDHVAGVATFVERHGPEVVMSAADAEIAARGGVGPGVTRPTYRSFTADRIIGHLDSVRVGDLTLIARLTPGHTPGCTTWQGQTAVDGEPLTWLSICSLGLWPTYTLVGDEETYPGIAADFCGSIAQLRAVDVDLFLGAHASFFALNSRRAAVDAGDPRALVDPARFPRFVERNATLLDSALVAQGEPEGCAGLGGGT